MNRKLLVTSQKRHFYNHYALVSKALSSFASSEFMTVSLLSVSYSSLIFVLSFSSSTVSSGCSSRLSIYSVRISASDWLAVCCNDSWCYCLTVCGSGSGWSMWSCCRWSAGCCCRRQCFLCCGCGWLCFWSTSNSTPRVIWSRRRCLKWDWSRCLGWGSCR